MNQHKTDVLSSWINLYDVVSGSTSDGVVSNRSGSHFCVYPASCTVRGTETANPKTFGQGRSR